MELVTIMATYTKKIIEDFETRWTPQRLSVAENVFTALIAGESLEGVQDDYQLTVAELESALRFFALYYRRNKSAVELYNNWQKRRFQTEDK